MVFIRVRDARLGEMEQHNLYHVPDIIICFVIHFKRFKQFFLFKRSLTLFREVVPQYILHDMVQLCPARQDALHPFIRQVLVKLGRHVI